LQQNQESLSERCRKVSDSISTTQQFLLNDASVALYRVQENVIKRVPLMIAERRELQATDAKLEAAIVDLQEASKIISQIKTGTNLNTANQWLQHALRNTL